MAIFSKNLSALDYNTAHDTRVRIMSTSRSGSSMDKRSRFETIALPLMKPVYNYALRLSRNRDEAKDLAQETFLRAYRTF